MPDLSLIPDVIARRDGVEAAVRLLVGKPLRFAGHAATLLWLHFGDVRTVSSRRGTREVGDYAVHTEAPWRIVGPDGIVTGKHDLFYDRAEPPAEADYDGDVPGETRLDKRLAELTPLLDRGALVVESAHVDRGGGLRLELTGGYRVEIFPVDSSDSEQWRMFQPGVADAPHLVMTGRGQQARDEVE